MSKRSKAEYLKEIRQRYQESDKEGRQKILDEFCRVCKYNRKYAISLLNGKRVRRKRKRPVGRPRRYEIMEFFRNDMESIKFTVFKK